MIDKQKLIMDLEKAKSNCKHLYELVFFDAVMAIVDRQQSANAWIPVSERLPEAETNVLIMQSYKETGAYANITIGHLHQPSDFRYKPYWSFIAYGEDMVHPKIEAYHRAEFICPGNEYVIAWQPLPEPYKEV